MNRPSRPSSLRRLRGFPRLGMLVLMVFVFALLVRSGVGAVGEIHEAVAHAAAHDHEGFAPATDAADAEDPVHALAVHAHCCGHAGMMAGSELLPRVFRAGQSAASATMEPPVTALHLSSPFRPPILG